MKPFLPLCLLVLVILACGPGSLPFANSTPSQPTPTVIVANFITAAPTPAASPTPTMTVLPTDTATAAPTQTAAPVPTATSEPVEIASPEPTSILEVVIVPPTAPVIEPQTAAPAAPAESQTDFVLRFVRMRTNEENSWDGTLGAGQCGSDHSIYVHVADAQENLLDGMLVGDRFGNFEVPTGVDGPGAVRILVWSATMELAVVGHQDGTRYTSDFTPPLSTLDEDIPLDWLQQAGYCASPEDCQWRVENNQLCRGHYSYDVIFQRTR